MTAPLITPLTSGEGFPYPAIQHEPLGTTAHLADVKAPSRESVTGLGYPSSNQLDHAMKSRDVFALAVRIVGLVVFLYGLEHLLYGVLGAAGILGSQSVKGHGIFGVCELVLGLLMMRGLTPLVEIAFPQDDTDPEETRQMEPPAEEAVAKKTGARP